MSLRCCSVGLLVGCVLALAGCGEDESAESGSPSDLSGRLLFSRFDESTHTFISTHISRPDGSGETEIAMPGPEGGGRWSRAGTHIAVMTERADHRIGTAIIAPDGSVTRVLDIPDTHLNLMCSVWSPDDSRLACEAWDEADPSRGGIYTVRSSDGGDLVRLTEPPTGTTDLPGDYSPDGAQVVFKRGSESEAPGTLMVVPATGGEPQRLSNERVDDPGRYSHDGKTVLTSSAGALLLLDSTGHRVGHIDEEGAFLFGAVWSPDGSHMAFSSASSGPFADIYTSKPDGTDRHRVTSTPDNEIVVEWGTE